VLTRKDDLLVQSIFYPFEMLSKRRAGISLRITSEGPTYDSASYGTVPFVDASAVLGDGTLSAFLVNRSLTDAAEVEVRLGGRALSGLRDAELLTGPGPKAANSFEEKELVRSRPFDGASVRQGRATVALPALSLVAATFGLD
jgi:alpha-N-arabinofuranosidase